MTGLWLLSYIVLWILVITLCLLVIGLLQQLGLVQQQLTNSTHVEKNDVIKESGETGQDSSIPRLSKDGPDIGSSVPQMLLDAYTSKDTITEVQTSHEHGTLLIFMAPTCESCQQLVDSLNQFVDNHVFKGQVLVVLRSDKRTLQAFLNIFPIHAPVVCDEDYATSMGFNIHRNPFGLFYDENGILVRKGLLLRYEGLQEIIGISSLGTTELENIYPPLNIKI